MREVLDAVIEAVGHGRPTALCRLVETRGSTPQKAGAAMAVFADGAQVGTLGGGCVEAEVKRHALTILDRGSAELVRFTLDSDYGWDDGLICGGRMTVLVEPLRSVADLGYLAQLGQLLASGAGGTEVIVFDAEKADLPAASCYLFAAEPRCLAATRDAGVTDAARAALAENLQPLAQRPQPRAAGGVAYLPLLPRNCLLIVGAGHVGQAVAQLAAELDFDVWVFDDRTDYASRERFPHAQRLIVADFAELAQIEVTPQTYALIVTRGHQHDEQALYHLVDRGAAYVGMIGSRRKIKLIFDDLLQEGVSAEALARVFAPVGIDIGSQTVMEIAVSIVAELIAFRNRSGDVPGRPTALAADSV